MTSHVTDLAVSGEMGITFGESDLLTDSVRLAKLSLSLKFGAAKMFGKHDNKNPFYVILLVAGCAFAITASAYGVMTVRELQFSREGIEDSTLDSAPVTNDQFEEVMDTYGPTLMAVELSLLAFGTFGAIAFDQRADRKSQLQLQSNSEETKE